MFVGRLLVPSFLQKTLLASKVNENKISENSHNQGQKYTSVLPLKSLFRNSFAKSIAMFFPAPPFRFTVLFQIISLRILSLWKPAMPINQLWLEVTCIVYQLKKSLYMFYVYSIEALSNLSRDMRKPDFCICENKAADQLYGHRTAGQRLCFRCIYRTIPLLSKSEISSL